MSVSSPLLKDLKGHILALSKPANNYAIPLNTYQAQEPVEHLQHGGLVSQSQGPGRSLDRSQESGGHVAQYHHCNDDITKKPNLPKNEPSSVNARAAKSSLPRSDSHISLSSSPECPLTLARLTFDSCDHWHSTQPPCDEGEHVPSISQRAADDNKCSMSTVPCTHHPLSPTQHIPAVDGQLSNDHNSKMPPGPEGGNTSPNFRNVMPRIRDSHPSLVPLCVTLEKILNDGLQGGHYTPFGFTKMSYWSWMSHLKDKCVGPFPRAIDSIVKSSLRGSEARGRLLLRFCLQYNCLQIPLLCKDNSQFYSPSSILAHEILKEIFLSLIRQLDLLSFDLDLENWSFLDSTWNLPITSDVELNPCLGLGLHLGHVAGRSVVIRVDIDGAAHRSGVVHTGDVITAINAKVIHGFNRINITQIFKEASTNSSCIRLRLVKGMDKLGRVYPPVIFLLNKLGLDLEEAKERRIVEEENRLAVAPFHSKSSSEKEVKHRNSVRETLPKLIEDCNVRLEDETAEQSYRDIETESGKESPSVWLVGSVEVGDRGDVSLISDAVLAVLRKTSPHQQIPVEFTTGEIGVKVYTMKGKTLLYHSYTEISACGRRDTEPLYFAYLAGDTTCSLSARFTCFVFKASTVEESSDILLTLADGFHRTHWAV